MGKEKKLTKYDLRCLIRGHHPEKDVSRFTDCLYGMRMIGREVNYDHIYEDIVCVYCEKKIHIPNMFRLDGRETIWRVYEKS